MSKRNMLDELRSITKKARDDKRERAHLYYTQQQARAFDIVAQMLTDDSVFVRELIDCMRCAAQARRSSCTMVIRHRDTFNARGVRTEAHLSPIDHEIMCGYAGYTYLVDKITQIFGVSATMGPDSHPERVIDLRWD